MSRHRLTRSSRALTFVALAAAVVVSACADLIGTGRGSAGTARVVLQPRFNQRDAEIYRGLPVFGLGVQTLRIVLLRPATTDTLADTTVIVDESQDSIAVKLTVVLNQAEEQLTAAMQMYSGDVLVFEGTRSITARAGVDLVGAAPTLVPVWVGPGASAVRLEIEPGDTTILANSSIELVARAFDGSDIEVTDPDYLGRLRWAVLDEALGSMPESGGAFTGAGTRGIARVMVFAPNLLRDTIELSLVPPATQIVTISGGGQTGNAGEALPQPFVVEVRAADNLPVPNVVVNFAATAGGGSVAPTSATTDASGRAQTIMTLGDDAEAQTFEATGAGLTPASVSVTAVLPQDPATIAFESRFEILNDGATLTRAATVRTDNGTVLPDEPITYSSRTPSVAAVDANGVITGVAPGQAVIVAQVAAATGIADSLLAVVAHVGGPVVLTSVREFALETETEMVVAIYVDMRSAKKLGSTTIDVEWDTARLTYVSHAPGISLSPTVNAANAGTGKLTLAMADPSGYSNLVELLRITFTTTATAGAGFLKATARELNEANAAVTDLLPITVNVIHTLRTH